MLATLGGLLALIVGLALLLLPVAVSELSRPRDSAWGAVVLLLGLVLVTSADRLTGAPMLAVLCAGLLIGRLGSEVGQARWRQLSSEEQAALGSSERWRTSLNQLLAVVAQLLAGLLTALLHGREALQKTFARGRQPKGSGKRWIRQEAGATDSSDSSTESRADSLTGSSTETAGPQEVPAADAPVLEPPEGQAEATEGQGDDLNTGALETIQGDGLDADALETAAQDPAATAEDAVQQEATPGAGTPEAASAADRQAEAPDASVEEAPQAAADAEPLAAEAFEPEVLNAEVPDAGTPVADAPGAERFQAGASEAALTPDEAAAASDGEAAANSAASALEADLEAAQEAAPDAMAEPIRDGSEDSPADPDRQAAQDGGNEPLGEAGLEAWLEANTSGAEAEPGAAPDPGPMPAAAAPMVSEDPEPLSAIDPLQVIQSFEQIDALLDRPVRRPSGAGAIVDVEVEEMGPG